MMSVSNLHIICGNCGNGEKQVFEYTIEKDAIYFAEKDYPDVFVTCKNCSTVHQLSEVFDQLPIKVEI